MTWKIRLFSTCLLSLSLFTSSQAQHSVARQWNDLLLDAIRMDFARPTVHSRNLFHISAAMYDAWAAYDDVAEPYMLGKSHQGFNIPFEGVPQPADLKAARNEALSFATYRLLNHRFQSSPGARLSLSRCDSLMNLLGYNIQYISTDYLSGNPAALGNYIAASIIQFGLTDGSNEEYEYRNQYYETVNIPLVPTNTGNYLIDDPDRWQSLTFSIFIDQSGNVIPGATPEFLGPEWGRVVPFSLDKEDLQIFERDGESYWVYHDPGAPPYINPKNGIDNSSEYQWGFSLVSLWSSHLDPNDGVLWDISPASIGNIEEYPTSMEGLRDFFDDIEGGDPSRGHSLNPHTGEAYAPQLVPRGDYARVLAEFWADGPDSETPPGHWFTILNYVSDHPDFEKRYKGEGAILDELEWDVKAYLTMGGAVHDAAVTAWGIKGYYDYIRPISALRWMAVQGQSSDPNLPHYSTDGLPLIPGLIELILEGDSMASGNFGLNLHKIKIKAWKGPDYIEDPETDMAGVGWILAEDWWPYQRPSFVTPPFAGYISGHSTFSRAAAEVMTLLTGDEFFPGGMGEFIARKNEFLVFEEGPSVDVVLQWATYRDASDQTSLSRIWGGIHPPVDDIPGRLIGEKIGVKAFAHAESFFTGDGNGGELISGSVAFPNPVRNGEKLSLSFPHASENTEVRLINLQGQVVYQASQLTGSSYTYLQIPIEGLATGMYIAWVKGDSWVESMKVLVVSQ